MLSTSRIPVFTGMVMRTPYARLQAFLLFTLLGAACVSPAASQPAIPETLSATLRDHVKAERLQVVTSIRGLPLGVREGLQALFGGQTLDIAESGAEFQTTEAIGNPKLPLRRLAAAGCSIEHCLVYYERGGATHKWVVALFHWTPAATRLEWAGNARGGLATIDNVRDDVVSGAVKGPVKLW
jgi:hypothetical protein